MKQFETADETHTRTDGSFDLHKWVLLYWLTAYALDPNKTKVPVMPMEVSQMGTPDVPGIAIWDLMVIPEWLKSSFDSVDELIAQTVSSWQLSPE